jgi:hypothetical protein
LKNSARSAADLFGGGIAFSQRSDHFAAPEVCDLARLSALE